MAVSYIPKETLNLKSMITHWHSKTWEHFPECSQVNAVHRYKCSPLKTKKNVKMGGRISLIFSRNLRVLLLTINLLESGFQSQFCSGEYKFRPFMEGSYNVMEDGRMKHWPSVKDRSPNTYYDDASKGIGTKLLGFEPQLCMTSSTSPLSASVFSRVKWT